jgi:hypothetical protein
MSSLALIIFHPFNRSACPDYPGPLLPGIVPLKQGNHNSKDKREQRRNEQNNPVFYEKNLIGRNFIPQNIPDNKRLVNDRIDSQGAVLV